MAFAIWHKVSWTMQIWVSEEAYWWDKLIQSHKNHYTETKFRENGKQLKYQNFLCIFGKFLCKMSLLKTYFVVLVPGIELLIQPLFCFHNPITQLLRYVPQGSEKKWCFHTALLSRGEWKNWMWEASAHYTPAIYIRMPPGTQGGGGVQWQDPVTLANARGPSRRELVRGGSCNFKRVKRV